MADDRRDPAADAAVAILLATGAACWGGLLLGLVGWFHLVPVLALALGGLALGWRSRESGRGGERWPWIDAALVFAVVAALALPGYDTSLYASDGTVYLGVAASLARSGSLPVAEPWLAKLWSQDLTRLFPPLEGWHETFFARSPMGLAFRGVGPVWSTFPQLPSVWLGIGWAVAGLDGARAVTPLLAAGALTAFHLVLRRAIGLWPALAGVALFTLSLPQAFFARFTAGEIGAQYFLWTGLVALLRWERSRSAVMAAAAGLGLGLAATARPEYLAFVPIALALGWTMGVRSRVALPGVTLAVMGILWAQAAVLYLLVVPSHYLAALKGLVSPGRLSLSLQTWGAPWAMAAAAATAVAVLAILVRLRRRGRWWRSGLVRVLLACALGGWAFLYASLTLPHDAGMGAVLLSWYLAWPLVALCAIGMPLLIARWSGWAAGRLAMLLGGVAAVHLLLDAHAFPSALWAGRRLLPAMLPVLFAAAAAAIGALAAYSRWAGLVLAAGALVIDARPLRHVWGRALYRGTGPAVEEMAQHLPADAVVILDPSLAAAGLDVALWLGAGRDAVQLSGAPGSIDMLWPILAASYPRPLYLARGALMPAPVSAPLIFTPAGRVPIR